MEPFRTREQKYDASIVLDASTVGDTTVTVSTYATRRQELAILDSIYQSGCDVGMRPFIDKATDLDLSDNTCREFFEQVIEKNTPYLRAVSHNTRVNGNADTHQVEALHSSILVDELLQYKASRRFESDFPEPLVIVDGGEQALHPLLYALEEIHDEEVAVTHCVKAELYYPTVLLADLTANYLAHAIENGTYDYGNPLLPTPVAKDAYSDRWSRGIEGIKKRRGKITPVEVAEQRGETARERVCCWYDGMVASGKGTERPLTDSINRVVKHVTENGYDRIAANLSKL